MAGRALTLSCSLLGAPPRLFDSPFVHREPKSPPDRALSYTALGTASGRWLWSVQGHVRHVLYTSVLACAPGRTPRGRQEGRRTARSRTAGLRRPMTDLSCAACAGTVSRSATRKAGLQPLMPFSWPPSERPAAVPDHQDLLDATCETLCGRGHGGTRSHTTSRRVHLCDTLSDQDDRVRRQRLRACGGRCTAPLVPL